MADQSIQEARAKALQNARSARDHLGQDTIERIAELMKQKEHSEAERAKAQIIAGDATRFAAELLYMLREE